MTALNQKLLAQVSSPLGKIGEGPGFGPFSINQVAPTGTGTEALVALTKIISTLIGVITISAGLYFIFQFLIGGFGWLSASGDKSRLTQAQDRLTHAVVGLIVVVATYGLMAVVGNLLGLDLLLVHPETIVNSLIF